MQAGKLVNSNYIWRILFTFLIVLGHSGYVNISHASYYIGVDYFFIISGLMIAYSVDRGAEMSTLDYTIKRIRKLYPHLILSFLCFFFITYYYCGLQSIMYELVSHLSLIHI